MQMDDDPLSGVSLNYETHSILLAAAHHDTVALKDLLRTGSANVQDLETGYTPLHAAIGACNFSEEVEAEVLDKKAKGSGILNAEETLRLLFENGAIWNDLDTAGETPGCLAWRLQLPTLYEMVVDAGVRAEVLLNRLDAFAPLEDEDDDDDDSGDGNAGDSGEDAGQADDYGGPETVTVFPQQITSTSSATDKSSERVPNHIRSAIEAAQNAASSLQQPCEPANVQAHTRGRFQGDELNQSNPAYLASRLTVTPRAILDADLSGVMMAWETALMEKTVDCIVPAPGLKILNIGHGMGIIDGFFASKHPASHHIIEAHRDVLAAMATPGTGFLARNPTTTLHDGRWQDILPKLLEVGETYDAIFFDTFAEDYGAFREFFSEYVVGLLAPKGKWSFFNGMGADRRVCYDVYTKVTELDLEEAGFDVEWTNIQVPSLTEDFHGVRRSYFALDEYRLPVCSFLS